MDKKIDEYQLRLSGLLSLPNSINYGKEFKVTITGDIDNPALKNNQDGTYNLVYKLSPIALEILTETGKVIKSVDKRKMSQKLRWYLLTLHSEHGVKTDEEVWKDQAYAVILANAEDILRKEGLL